MPTECQKGEGDRGRVDRPGPPPPPRVDSEGAHRALVEGGERGAASVGTSGVGLFGGFFSELSVTAQPPSVQRQPPVGNRRRAGPCVGSIVETVEFGLPVTGPPPSVIGHRAAPTRRPFPTGPPMVSFREDSPDRSMKPASSSAKGRPEGPVYKAGHPNAVVSPPNRPEPPPDRRQPPSVDPQPPLVQWQAPRARGARPPQGPARRTHPPAAVGRRTGQSLGSVRGREMR